MKNFRQQMQQQLLKMIATGKLFRADISGADIWALYLGSFKLDPTFRDPESTMHNCNHCNNFVRRYGNIVALDENFKLMTLFDIAPESEEYVPVAKALDSAIRMRKIRNVFFETYKELNALPYESCSKTASHFKLGIDSNVKRYTPEEAEKFGVVEPDEIRTFEHMSISLPAEFVLKNQGSIESVQAKYRDAKEVFARGMEISLDTFKLVIDLIKQGSLLNGDAHLKKIEEILPLREVFEDIPRNIRDNWCWDTSYKLPFAKFRNDLIGVLCTELSEGMEINKACLNWNKRVDPVNYMKATAPITKSQIKEAKIFVEDNGYESAFSRRPATIDDIKASEILHLNSGDGALKEVSVFDSVKSTSTRHKRSEFKGIEEVPIEKFMKDILPGCTSVEAFLANSHENNMVTLTTAKEEDSKAIFKWNNNYSWTFNGNLAGKSMIKEAVKLAGGEVEGILNVRLAWNDGDGNDASDLDLWATEAGGVSIGYDRDYRKDSGNRRSPGSGQLDVDVRDPRGKLAVENITWTDLRKMADGVYKMWVNPFTRRHSQGFKAEIEFDGQMYSYNYPESVNKNVTIAEVTLSKGEFTIKHMLPVVEGEGVSKDVYGLETNQFHTVNLMCLSPNHWGDNAVGNKHYMFMLDGATSGRSIRSFHNENLKSDLVAHRKVMEVLANTTMVESAPKELSGLGFNSTVRDEVILRLKGSHKRVIKVKF